MSQSMTEGPDAGSAQKPTATVPPFDQREGVIWLDGELVPWKEARVHYLTHGLHYASFVYEGIRVYSGRIFKLEEHIERLFNSARILGFEIPYTPAQLCAETERTVAAMNVHDGYIRPAAWLGSEMIQIAAPMASVHVGIATWVVPADFYSRREDRMNGISMTISKWARPSPKTEPVHSKASGLYMVNTMSKHAALAAGYNDALMLDYEGNVAEGTGANIFFVKDGELHTPTPTCFLDGITRRTIMGLAEQAGIRVIERTIRLPELAEMSEAFLTGTAAEVTAIGSIAEYEFNDREITRTLAQAYHELIHSSDRQ